MYLLHCDKCRKEILNGSIYYQVKRYRNNNDMFKDCFLTICPDCADDTLNHLFVGEG